MHAHRTTRLAAIGFALVLVLAACGSSGGSGGSGSSSGSNGTTTTAASSDSGGGGTKITIEGFKFTPNDVKAKVGDKITVTNNDPATHTFTSTKGSVQTFDSGDLAKGKSYTITLTKKGTISYDCTIHNYMMGKIEVS